MEEYDVIEIQGKHGIIHLHIPKSKPVQSDIDEVYEAVAEIAINNKKEKPADK